MILRYVFKSKVTNEIFFNYYYIHEIEKGTEKLSAFFNDDFEVIGRDLRTKLKDIKGIHLFYNDVIRTFVGDIEWHTYTVDSLEDLVDLYNLINENGIRFEIIGQSYNVKGDSY